MEKILSLFIITFMLCVNMSVVASSTFTFSDSEKMEIISDSVASTSKLPIDKMVDTISKYVNLKGNRNDVYLESARNIELPQINHDDEIFGWWVRLEYNGETFEKEIDISINDFQEKFLKHPEYGEIIYFDLDDDSDNDVEVIVGFYWSVIQNSDNSQSKSLEMRFRLRQLEAGGYIDDSDGELEVWSELHVNYGLVKNSSISKPSTSNLKNVIIDTYKSELQIININLINQILGQKKNVNFLITDIFGNILSRFQQKNLDDEPFLDMEPLAADNDYISIGAGYYSPSGVDIPRFTEKRFAFAKDNIFSPTIFQHEIDFGSSKGKGPIELLYGFRSFKEGDSIDNPSYDIAFSVEFDPAVYLKTKFVPLGGYIYYYFNQDSQQNSDTKIAFKADIDKGSGEGVELTLVFDKIDSSLGQSGRWMSFDVDALGDHDPFGGGFKYRASHNFNVGVIVSIPSFNENYNKIEAKLEIKEIPTSIDVNFDLDIRVLLYGISKLDIDISGDVNLNMNSDLGGITLYYPKPDIDNPDIVLLDVPNGIPSDIKLGAEARAFVDLNDIQSSSNFIFGEIYHECSSNIDKIQVFLPEIKTPVIEVTDIPSYSHARGELYWNRLQGYAYVSRSSSGRQDPIKIHLEFGDSIVENMLEIRDGYVSTGFKIAEDGYFNFDTSKKMFANTLHVVNDFTGDELTLIVDEVSADNLQADWNIDTSGDSLKINNIKFGGIIDTLRDLKLDLKYKGKTTAFNLDWILGQEGQFDIKFDQGSDTTIDFDLGKNSNMFDFLGSVTLSQKLQFDMNWQFRQGSSTFDPGHFTINEFNDGPNLKNFNLYFTYQDTYGVEIDFYNFKVYLDLEWWKGDRILPYIWLDYEVGVSDLDVDLLWNGEWYYNIEDWGD